MSDNRFDVNSPEYKRAYAQAKLKLLFYVFLMAIPSIFCLLFFLFPSDALLWLTCISFPVMLAITIPMWIKVLTPDN